MALRKADKMLIILKMARMAVGKAEQSLLLLKRHKRR
jgi:hypothetical protein